MSEAVVLLVKAFVGVIILGGGLCYIGYALSYNRALKDSTGLLYMILGALGILAGLSVLALSVTATLGGHQP